MCGILGGLCRSDQIAEADISAALALLQHRGPDADGIYQEAPAFLGHRRLSIIDLDARANQPFRRGPLVMSYNGEIYNFRRVRSDLETLGCVFQTESDTEVILEAFRLEGRHCVERFEGMFAIAIWNEESRRLTLLRDRFGEKPLIYFQDRDRFFFASEIPALERLVGREHLEVDTDAIGLFFQLTYIPAPATPYCNMHQLAPGGWLELDFDQWSAETGFHYVVSSQSRTWEKASATEELRTLLESSVDLRLAASDVPVATFLSGGVDSSIISALATSSQERDVHAYSIGYPEDPDFDESPYARMVAEQYPQMRHTVIDATERNLLEFTDRFLKQLGEPHADASIIPTAYLCSHVEEKVVLGGDGADELFAGYGVYAAMRTSNQIPVWVKRILKMLPAPQNGPMIKNPKIRAAALFLDHLGLSPQEEYASWRNYAAPGALEKLGVPVERTAKDAIGSFDFDKLTDLLAKDIRFNLADDMLKKVDLASMRYSLEVRLPFLDRSLVEFALSLPDEFLINGHERKHIVRDAFRTLLPAPIFSRRKQGFLLPIRRWFQSGPIRDVLFDLASQSATLDRDAISKIADEHTRGQRDHSELLWSCLCFLTWQSRPTA